MLKALGILSCGCVLMVMDGKSAASFGYERRCVGGSSAGAV